MLLALVLALVAPPVGSAEIAGARHRELVRPGDEAPAPAPWVERRELSFEPVEGGLKIRGRWLIRSLKDGWFSGRLFAAAPGLRVVSARWGEAPAALQVDASGGTVTGRVQGRAELRAEVFVPADPARAPLSLQLLPAVRGGIEVRAPAGLVAALRADGAPALAIGEVHWSGAQDIELSFVTPPAPVADRPPVVMARVGIGLTVGDAELRGRARAVWEVRQGEIDAVELDTAGLGADLEVTGAGVRAFARAGERVRIELQAPVRDRVEVELRWTAAIARGAESRVAIPTITPVGVFHGEAALQLARDGEVEAVPDAPGWSFVAGASLPGWAQGLVEGTATASLRPPATGAAGGSLSLLRFVPLEGPPMVIDVAAYTVATSREGRALVRAHYEVRNERAAHLRLTPPAGFRVIGVRVGGTTAAPARASDGSWIIPLLRSVETVQGLLSFPIEVILLGEAEVWRRRETRSLALPVVDAPIAVSRLTLHLPPGYRSRKKPGEGDVVAKFTRGEGITYGLGFGEVGAAQADAVFQEAVQSWLRNDFGAAQQKLDELQAMGAKNENISRLQSNLDVVTGKASGSQDMSLQRRVREQAKARAYADVQAQAELKKKAEEERARGDYEAAASSYRKALDVGGKLAQLEQTESVEQKVTNARIAEEFAELRTKAGDRRKIARRARPQSIVTKSKDKAVYDFADDEIAGDRMMPEGANTSAGPALPERDGDGVADELDAAPGLVVDGISVSGEAASAGYEAPPAEAKEGAIAGGEASPALTGATEEQPIARASLPPEPIVTGVPAASDADAPAARERVSVGDAVRRANAVGRSFKAVGQRVRGHRVGRAEAARDTTTRNQPVLEMPTPVVHASALSVVVPAVGEAVRYQRLLLPAGAAYAVEIAAKEPLIAKE